MGHSRGGGGALLKAAGEDAAIAVPAVFLYRLVTFWLPIPVGWFAWTKLQRAGAL